MHRNDTHPAVAHYLDELYSRLQYLPYGTAHETYQGIAEELLAHDAVTAERRIAELGAPEVIAAELAAELSTGLQSMPSSRVGHSAVVPPASDHASVDLASPRGVRSTVAIVGTALAVAIGGVVIPVLGWILGIVLMWLSPVWGRLQKWVTTLAPLVFVFGAMLVVALIARTVTGAAPGGFAPPAGAELPVAENPLIPSNVDMMWLIFLGAGIVPFVSGVILLIVGLKRAKREKG